MTYKFEQFNVEIVDPAIQVITILDTIALRTCSVEVLLTTDTANFGISLSGFTYVTDWNDEEVELWTLTELSKYAV
tara:strand:+ start:216 stop:443 length:228 start_codon:yes stop_codon:yes gene_type:complete